MFGRLFNNGAAANRRQALAKLNSIALDTHRPAVTELGLVPSRVQKFVSGFQRIASRLDQLARTRALAVPS